MMRFTADLPRWVSTCAVSAAETCAMGQKYRTDSGNLSCGMELPLVTRQVGTAWVSMITPWVPAGCTPSTEVFTLTEGCRNISLAKIPRSICVLRCPMARMWVAAVRERVVWPDTVACGSMAAIHPMTTASRKQNARKLQKQRMALLSSPAQSAVKRRKRSCL